MDEINVKFKITTNEMTMLLLLQIILFLCKLIRLFVSFINGLLITIQELFKHLYIHDIANSFHV